ncbi:cyanophycinase-like [Haliotis cracherodii]|uniref:cyanophycinase-like n=1 Tax=Haliotis cracherodii TaxID=6455 RepID=UPI0039ED454F
MVTGGVSWNALTYGAHETSSDRNALTYRQHGGIGIYDGYILDTFRSSHGREGRLIRLLSDTQHLPHGVLYGIGVDPNTALVVTEARTSNEIGEVFGTHGVSLVDVSKSYVDPFHTYFDIRKVYMSYLTAGDTISMVSHNVSVSSTKTLLTGNESHTHAVTSSDIFFGASCPAKKTEFLRVAASIVDARKDLYSYGDTYEKHPRFRVTMSKTGTHTGSWVERPRTFNSDIISYKNMYLEINAH